MPMERIELGVYDWTPSKGWLRAASVIGWCDVPVAMCESQLRAGYPGCVHAVGKLSTGVGSAVFLELHVCTRALRLPLGALLEGLNVVKPCGSS